jgi:chromosome partitioning protein
MNKDLSIIEPILLSTNIENVHLAPAHPELMMADAKDESVLRKSLIGARNIYDYILIDTPPGNYNLIMNGISAADHVVLTLDPGIFALEGIEDFSDFLKKTDNIDLDFKPDMIILTKAQSAFLKKVNPAKEIRNELEDMFMKNIYIVPYSIDIYESHKKGLPVSHSFPKGNAGKAYKKIADDLLKL